jgi:plastocyanin
VRARLFVLCGVLTVANCADPDSVSQSVGPTGGEVCLPDGRACISIPLQALDRQMRFAINLTDNVPGGAIGQGFDITADNGPVWFGKQATVTLKYEEEQFLSDGGLVDGGQSDGGFNFALLRVYTLNDAGTWAPLADNQVDRARAKVSGKTWHLSPFVLLRSDLLPDGGLPIELDGGQRDSGMPPPPPPFDASRPDSGYDAGRPDSGTPDSGTPDSGTPDSGTPDSGTPDSGTPDSGTPDSGTPDSGQPDSGTPDAGQDAGYPACVTNFANCTTYTDFSTLGPDAGIQVDAMSAGFTYSPRCVQIKAGQAVNFAGVSPSHPTMGTCGPATTIGTVTVDNTSLVFNTAGDYGFFCQNHGDADGGGMAGSIRVLP